MGTRKFDKHTSQQVLSSKTSTVVTLIAILVLVFSVAKSDSFRIITKDFPVKEILIYKKSVYFTNQLHF